MGIHRGEATRHLVLHQHRAIQPDGPDVWIAEVILYSGRDRVGIVVLERSRLSQIDPDLASAPGDLPASS
jgi:hypothetical protein